MKDIGPIVNRNTFTTEEIEKLKPVIKAAEEKWGYDAIHRQHGGKRPGAGRKATGRSEPISISIKVSEEAYAILEGKALDKGLSVGGYVKKLVMDDVTG